MRKFQWLVFAAITLALVTGSALADVPSQAPPQPGQLPPASPSQPDPNGAMQLPNTISAPPFTVADKFDYRVVQTFGLRGLFGAAIGASISQATGTPYAWGGGVEGFAKRYGSGLLGNVSRQSFAFVLESAFHEDPRYFPSQERTFKARLTNSVKQVFICKTDGGRSSFAYGRVGSAFAAGQLVNAWEPGSNGHVYDGLERGVFTLGGDFAYNLLQEFFPFARPRSIRHRH